MIRTASLILLTALLISCGPSKSDESDGWDKENVKNLEADDKRVAEAMKLAQDSIGFFIRTYREFHRDQRYMFSLKSKFSQEEVTEHIWLRPIRLDEENFAAVIDNIPQTLTTIKFGDTVSVDFRNIEDIIIVYEDSLVVGSFLSSMLPPEN